MAEAEPLGFAGLGRIALVGAGRAGCSMAAALGRHGPVTLVARARWRRQAVTGWLAGAGLAAKVHVVADLRDVAAVDTVLFAVPDGALAEAARSAIGHGRAWLHLSGAMDAAAIDVDGAPPVLGAAHPLASLPDPVATAATADRAAAPLVGALLALDGSAGAIALGQALASAVGAVGWPVAGPGRAAYHAAAAVVANDLIGLLNLGETLAASAGLPTSVARAALVHLARTALDAAAAVDPARSLAHGLTGAVARGDAGTLGRHLQVLETWPEGRDIHIALSRQLLALVVEAGLLRPAQAAAVAIILDS